MKITTTPTLLVAGAVVLASATYAVASQTGSGQAGAATKASALTVTGASGATGATGQAGGPFAGRSFGPGGRHGFGDRDRGAQLASAAKTLGVSQAQLQAALQDLAPARALKGERRDDLAAALAKALGVDQAKVTSALDAQRPAMPDRTARFGALAKELGLSADKVQQAFEAVRPERRGQDGTQAGRDVFLAALAKQLGVDETKLTAALGKVGPGPGGPGGHRGAFFDGRGPGGPGGPGLDTAALAKALGVDEAKITGALTAFRTTEQQRHADERAAFVKALAAKLNVSEAKVTEALGAPGRRP